LLLAWAWLAAGFWPLTGWVAAYKGRKIEIHKLLGVTLIGHAAIAEFGPRGVEDPGVGSASSGDFLSPDDAGKGSTGLKDRQAEGRSQSYFNSLIFHLPGS